MICKKIFIFLCLSLIAIPTVFWEEQTITDPRWTDISASAQTNLTIPFDRRIRGNTASASQYCTELWASFASYSTFDDGTNITTVRYNTNTELWLNSWSDRYIDTVICNFPDPEEGTGSLVNSFVEIDFSSLTYEDEFISNGSWTFISYTKQLQDQNRILYQILYLLTAYVFFMFIWIFYSFINDLLWKR